MRTGYALGVDSIKPSNTADAIARVRASEARLPEERRLFEDPYARHFDAEHADVEGIFQTIPFFVEQVRLRTRYLDDCVRDAIREGTRQVVLLGAGFDMRALRMPEIVKSHTRVVEVDHLEQLDKKQERLAAAGVAPPRHVTYAAADLMLPDGELEAALHGAGLDPTQRVLWLAEGLIGYLSAEAVARVGVATHRLSAPGSSWVGNHFVAAFSLERLKSLLEPAGWTVTAGPTFADLYRQHIGPEVPPGSEAFALFRATQG